MHDRVLVWNGPENASTLGKEGSFAINIFDWHPSEAIAGVDIRGNNVLRAFELYAVVS